MSENWYVLIFRGLHDLIFPARCIGCESPQQIVCLQCTFEYRLRDLRTHVGTVPVFSSIAYGTKASRLLLAAKEDGIRTADDILVAALQHSFHMAVLSTGIRPALVPIPHSKEASRKRGRDFVAEITRRLSHLEGVPMRQVIRHHRKVADQSTLGANLRFGNVAGAMEVACNCVRASEVFLVDDVMTTGATLGEAVRTLEKAGFHVLAAVTALVALPLR